MIEFGVVVDIPYGSKGSSFHPFDSEHLRFMVSVSRLFSDVVRPRSVLEFTGCLGYTRGEQRGR